jgi:hypothetical protein
METLDAAALICNQAEHHFLMETGEFSNLEELCLHLRHVKGYEMSAAEARRKRVLDLGCNNAYGTFADTRNVDSALDLVAVCSPQRHTSELQQIL